MSSQKAIAAVRQFAPAKDNGVSFVKELTIGLVLGLAAGGVWKVNLRRRPPSPGRPSFPDPGFPETANRSMQPLPFPRRGIERPRSYVHLEMRADLAMRD